MVALFKVFGSTEFTAEKIELLNQNDGQLTNYLERAAEIIKFIAISETGNAAQQINYGGANEEDVAWRLLDEACIKILRLLRTVLSVL